MHTTRTRLPIVLSLCISIGVIIAALLYAPTATLAQGQGDYTPIVQCGTGTGADFVPCNLCDLYVLVRRIIDFLLYVLALPIAVIVLLIGGLLLLTSAGDPGKIQQGKAAISNAVLGLVIAFAAWLLINTVMTTLAFKGSPFTQGVLPWNEIPKCETPITTTGGAPSPSNIRYCVNAQGQNLLSSCSTISCDVCTSQYNGSCTFTPPTGCGAGSPSGRSCTIPQSGACSPAMLASWGARSSEAAKICTCESGGASAIGSRADLTNNPCPPGVTGAPYANRCSFSWGLFQINLKVHSINGINCPSAFNGNTIKSDPVSQDIFKKCVAAAQNPQFNITKAIEIFNKNSTPWGDWSCRAICRL